jgi:hypothetical protein
VGALYGILPSEYQYWDLLYTQLQNVGLKLFRQQSRRPKPIEWLGVYQSPTNPFPSVIFQGRSLPEEHMDGRITSVLLIKVPDGYSVQQRSCMLSPLPITMMESRLVVRAVIH